MTGATKSAIAPGSDHLSSVRPNTSLVAYAHTPRALRLRGHDLGEFLGELMKVLRRVAGLRRCADDDHCGLDDSAGTLLSDLMKV